MEELAKNSFSEEDYNKIVTFLNFIAKEAEFTGKTEKIREYFLLLGHMQSTILPKIKDHIFKVEKVNRAKNKDSKKADKGK